MGTREECQGDEVEYLELSQSGSQVTGQICEAYGKDCAQVEDGMLSGSKLEPHVSTNQTFCPSDLPVKKSGS